MAKPHKSHQERAAQPVTEPAAEPTFRTVTRTIAETGEVITVVVPCDPLPGSHAD